MSTILVSKEKKAIAVCGAVFASRLLGLFMVLPVLTLYTERLPGANALTMGLAAGIYGLMTALMQLPMGWYSDRVGRKRVLLQGQCIFIAGSLVCAGSSSIGGLIVGRAFQGIGAVGSTLMAAVADQTRPEVRARAMAFMGMIIGGSFLLALGIGPLLAPWWGVQGLFVASVVLGTVGLGILWRASWPLPLDTTAVVLTWSQAVQLLKQQSWQLLRRSNVLLWVLGVGLLHASLMAGFVVWPKLLNAYWPNWVPSTLYLQLLLGSVCLVMPFIRWVESRQRLASVAPYAWLVLCVSQLLMALGAYQGHFYCFYAGMFAFFVGFNFLEAYLPAQLSKHLEWEERGTGMGLFSSSQFLGTFIGALIGARILGHSYFYLFLFGGGVAIISLAQTLYIRSHYREESNHAGH